MAAADERQVRDLERKVEQLASEIAQLRSAAADSRVRRLADEQSVEAISLRLPALLFTDSERTESTSDLAELQPLAIAIRDGTATAVQQRRFFWLMARAVLRFYRGLFQLAP